MIKFIFRSPGRFNVVQTSEVAAVLRIEHFCIRMPLQHTRPAVHATRLLAVGMLFHGVVQLLGEFLSSK